MRMFKIVAHVFGKNRRSKRTKRLALLNSVVENIFHVGAARVNNNRTIAQRARSKFHPALKPSDDQPVSNVLRRALCYFLIRERFINKLGLLEFDANLLVGKFRTRISASHHVASLAIQDPVMNLVTNS